MLSTLGARSFYAAVPCLWNSLPAELRDIQSLCSFKRKLIRPIFFELARAVFLLSYLFICAFTVFIYFID